MIIRTDLKDFLFPWAAIFNSRLRRLNTIANDGVVLQLTNYREGIYSPEEAARLLQDRYLDQQYYFGTERALRLLRKTNVETV